MKFKVYLIFLGLVFYCTSFAQTVYSDPSINKVLDKDVYFLIDSSAKLNIKEVSASKAFAPVSTVVQNFGISKSPVWFKLKIKNETNFKNLILQVNQPIIDRIDFFCWNDTLKDFGTISLGEYKNFSERTYSTPDYLFDVVIPTDSTCTYFLKVQCKENMQVPIQIGTRVSILEKIVTINIASGIYFGIMMVMILYNLFVYFTLRDSSYLWYSSYIILILLTQTSLQGYTFQFLWPNMPKLAEYSPFFLPAAVGVIGLEFFKHFLKIKERIPVAYKLSFLFLIPYTVSFVLALFDQFKLSFMMVEATASLVSVFMLTFAAIIYKKGFSEARFFLIGWSVFLLGVIIYVMKDFEVFPYNNFTRYTMHFGSAIEVILLSFALADRINILKKEKEQSQAEALEAYQQNQKLITEQNIILEQKVHERTLELEETNEELNVTLNYLKDTQSQLVNAEKMASLGQLTAGIAHEINNPINFVSANLKPLRMDIDDVLQVVNKYETVNPNDDLTAKLNEINLFKKSIDLDYLKQEIQTLLKGIEDGAKRTAEIVQGLKNFSRLDESDLKEANINEGIESTLVILRSSVKAHTKIVTELGKIPLIECYPGKLNQVFMNIFSNAIYAMNKKNSNEENFLTIKSYEKGENVIVTIEDTGIGMTAEAKEKIFEPFFTTKDVGEGTGLGMSIVFKIIESHHAKLEIESEVGVGTKMTLILNKRINK